MALNILDAGSPDAHLSVTIYLDDEPVVQNAIVSVGSLGTVLPINTAGLQTSGKPYQLTCKAEVSGQTYTDTTELLYLPPSYFAGGSMVKIDRRSGAFLIFNGDFLTPRWDKMIPFGWYDVRLSPSCGPNTDTSRASTGKKARRPTQAYSLPSGHRRRVSGFPTHV
jgi:hypothetical protein